MTGANVAEKRSGTDGSSVAQTAQNGRSSSPSQPAREPGGAVSSTAGSAAEVWPLEGFILIIIIIIIPDF